MAINPSRLTSKTCYPIASLTSESDSTTFAGEEMQRHVCCFFSLTMDMNRVSENSRLGAWGATIHG